MKNVKLSNKRAGTIKLPGGSKLKKGQSKIVPVSVLAHKSIRKLLSSGRMQVSSVAKRIESSTDSLIHAARDVVDAAINIPAIEEASDKVLDAVENAVEEAVDATIEAVSDAAEGALDAVAGLFGVSEEPKVEEPKEEKPKRRGRRKKSADK